MRNHKTTLFFFVIPGLSSHWKSLQQDSDKSLWAYRSNPESHCLGQQPVNFLSSPSRLLPLDLDQTEECPQHLKQAAAPSVSSWQGVASNKRELGKLPGEQNKETFLLPNPATKPLNSKTKTITKPFEA